jgi:hypothetical protein
MTEPIRPINISWRVVEAWLELRACSGGQNNRVRGKKPRRNSYPNILITLAENQ